MRAGWGTEKLPMKEKLRRKSEHKYMESGWFSVNMFLFIYLFISPRIPNQIILFCHWWCFVSQRRGEMKMCLFLLLHRDTKNEEINIPKLASKQGSAQSSRSSHRFVFLVILWGKGDLNGIDAALFQRCRAEMGSVTLHSWSFYHQRHLWIHKF